MKSVGRSAKTYENWRSVDEAFRLQIDSTRERRSAARTFGVDESLYSLTFRDWRKKFLGQDTYPHQQEWIDFLEGREFTPRAGEVYDPSDPNRVIINVPPFHSKSQTITIEYVTYRICMNRNVRVIIVSKRQDQARKFLYSIKQRLTSNQWATLQGAYAPEGGFKADRGDGAAWGADKIYVRGIDSGEKDPTVEAIGLGGQIYGSRADLIILDDCIVGSNAGEFEKQINWLESEVENRVKDGKILVIGTRLATQDLYSELRNGERYLSGKSPWSYLGQPIVLEFAEDPADWKTLWPYSSSPMETGQKVSANGLYEAWPGAAVAKLRGNKPPRIWSLVYMQQNVADDAVFDPKCVLGSVNGRRKVGPLRAGAWGHPRNGSEGQYVIGSIDPAASGDAFILLLSVEKATKQRRVLNCFVRSHTIPSWYADQIEFLTPEYGVNEWVIEQNAYANWLIYDERITRFCREHGVRITPHYTSRNKQDPDFGVASMASLFGSLRRIHDGSGRAEHDGGNTIELPDQNSSEGVRSLIEQLITWQPGKKGKDLKMDGPMALWFAELRAREILGLGVKTRQTHMRNPYLTAADISKRSVLSLTQYRAAGE